MSTTNDNIGGLKKIEILAVNQIRVMYESGFATVLLTDTGKWSSVPFQGKSCTIEVTPEDTPSGRLYNIDINIFIPRHLLTAALENQIKRLLSYGGIIRYTTGNDEIFVIGSKQYPLISIYKYLHPGASEGFSGKKLILSGKNLHPQLPYKQ